MAVITSRPDLAVCPPPPFQGKDRSPGLHLSNIISYIERVAYKQKRSAISDMSEKEYDLFSRRANLGWMWEKVLDYAHAERCTKDWPDGRGKTLIEPGELYMDAIYLTPDRYNVEDDRAEEFKATWKSSRGLFLANGDVNMGVAEEKLRGYMMQLKAACRALCTTKGRLRIFYVNSDYSRNDDSKGPMEYVVLDLDWTVDEIEENWCVILNHSPIVAKELGILWPPIQ